MKRKKSEYQKRLELFFLSPRYSENSYIKLYSHNYPDEDRHAYSPLYRLRRELYKLKNRKQWLSAMLIPSIIIEGLVRYIYSPFPDKFEQRNYIEKFIKKYLKFQGIENVLIRLYRNAQEHNFAFLFTRVFRKGRTNREFKSISSYLHKTYKYKVKEKFEPPLLYNGILIIILAMLLHAIH